VKRRFSRRPSTGCLDVAGTVTALHPDQAALAASVAASRSDEPSEPAQRGNHVPLPLAAPATRRAAPHGLAGFARLPGLPGIARLPGHAILTRTAAARDIAVLSAVCGEAGDLPASPAERDARALALLLDLATPVLDLATPVLDLATPSRDLATPFDVAASWPASVAARPASQAAARATADGQSVGRGRPRKLPGVLLVVLAVQTVLSIRLVSSNSAFPDEALYLWAGRAEINYWLHGGAAIEPFSTFLSGSPVIYPPIGALADSIGGLAAARILSLCFMLGATTLLHGVTRRIFDRTSALFAIGLFAGTAATQFLGAFATYDAMALFLLALATWLGILAIGNTGAARLALLAAAGSALAVADAAKYAAALFDLIVIAIVALATWQRRGRGTGFAAAAVMLGTLFVLLAAGLFAAGPAGWQGVKTTTLLRHSSNYPIPYLLLVSAKWAGVVALLAVIGAVTVACTRRSRPIKLLAGVLAAAVFLVPAEQARIHTYTSLFKHLGYGEWFGAIVAGVAFTALAGAVPPAKAAAARRIGVATVCLAVVPAIPWATACYGWPDSLPLIAALRPILAATHGPVLADERGNVEEYYLPDEVNWRQLYGTWYFRYDDPQTRQRLTGLRGYNDAIGHRYFAVIALNFWDTAPTDRAISRDIKRLGGYRCVADIPYSATGTRSKFKVWVRDPSVAGQ
jgi:4-amino-4-deoxy-L-arabinose transferase-like glycosyltransferase